MKKTRQVMKKTVRNTIIILGVLAVLAGTLVFLFRDGANKSVGTKALSLDGTEATAADGGGDTDEGNVPQNTEVMNKNRVLPASETPEQTTETLDKEAQSGTAEVVYDGSNGQHFAVIIPKYIALGSDKTADYQVTVKGDVAQGSKVKVEPQDDDEATEGVNFIMSPAGAGSATPVNVTQDDVYWDYAEITANEYNGTAKDGHIDGSLLTVGNWSGNMTFLINFEDEYGMVVEDFADPVLDNWEYTFDRKTSTIYLRKYTGNETDVVVSSPYTAPDGHKWTVKLNDDSSKMFLGDRNVQTISFNNIDTSNVTNMRSMFTNCYDLTSLDVSCFDTSNVTDMAWMFGQCRSLTSLDVSGFDTSNVKDMTGMFGAMSDPAGLSLDVLDVSGFNTSKVEDMTSMFARCSKLTSLDISGFDTSNVTFMGNMFEGCSNLNSLDVSGFDTSNVTYMGAMFRNCSNLSSLNVHNFRTSNVTFMGSMFEGCSNLNSLDVSGFDTSNVTGMNAMFEGCSNLDSLNVFRFNTSKVTKMRAMFEGCSKLVELDLSNFNTSNVTDMINMFRDCERLSTIYVECADTFIPDGCVTSGMFFNCGCQELVWGE